MRLGSPAFTTVRTEGGLLPADLLQRVATLDKTLDGLSPESYLLLPREKLKEAINRSWGRLQGAWVAFQTGTSALAPGDAATGITRERWLLVIFSELDYGRLPLAKGLTVEGRTFAISHQHGQIPIHLVGQGVSIDRRAMGIAGVAGSSPHSLVQEFLNRAEGCLWGFVSNGLVLRVLRDNRSLTRQAFVEFDLAAMMAEEQYADFALLWLLCHASRVEGERLETCWLEKWSKVAQDQGIRLLDHLRDGVERAITACGRGFLSHPANEGLRGRLRSGALSREDYYRQVLRLIYRLIFLLVAEDRDLLLSPDAPEQARLRYQRYYSVARLRLLAERRCGTSHGEFYVGLRLVMGALAETGSMDLGLPTLGSFLWADEALPDLGMADIANRDLLEALRALSYTVDGKVRRAVDYRNLDTDKLGSVYEALLDLHPDMDSEAGHFELRAVAGSERKQTGSYYTPSSLVNCLLDSALDPVLDEACKRPEPEKAILALKVCDPACGSGRFLIAAAHRMAKRLAAVRTGNEEPDPTAVRRALRDVVSHCIHGVDINEMAVELCKVTLWLEALAPGRPLSDLDQRIQIGNSLIGATPASMAKGIPDEVFTAIGGDDRAYCAELKAENRKRMPGLYDPIGAEESALSGLASEAEQIDAIEEVSMAHMSEKAAAWQRFSASESSSKERLAADAWSAAFVRRKIRDLPMALTHGRLRRIHEDSGQLPDWFRNEIRFLAAQYRFFHWHLAFPDVFSPSRGQENPTTGWSGGFDVILGNPPWEVLEEEEKKFFASSRKDIAKAGTERRKALISKLVEDDPALSQKWIKFRDERARIKLFLRSSGRFPLSSYKKINLYASMLENGVDLLRMAGRLGMVLPSGLATDESRSHLFWRLVESSRLRSLLDFENVNQLFPGVHAQQRFCLVTVSLEPCTLPTRFSFSNHRMADLLDPERTFFASSADLRRISPNTGTCPTFRNKRDANMILKIHEQIPVFRDDSKPDAWSLEFMQMFNSSSDSNLFEFVGPIETNLMTQDWLPVYEGKFLNRFNHRLATFYGCTTLEIEAGSAKECSSDSLEDPTTTVVPRWWIPHIQVNTRLESKSCTRKWFLAFCDIANPENVRTARSAILPYVGASDTLWLLLGDEPPEIQASLCAMINSFVLDYVARRRIGSRHLKQHIFKQLPLLGPDRLSGPCPWIADCEIKRWLLPRVLELTYTSWDLAPFAEDCGFDGPPFRWDEERRSVIEHEIDSAFFHLYGIGLDDVGYILETFPIVKRNDEQRFGEFRTKREILEIYEAMAETTVTGEPYQTRLDPPPADPRATHPERPLQAGAAITRPTTPVATPTLREN